MKRVAGKVALVTGAGLGLGRASALMLAREGARVVVTDVNEEQGRSAADQIIDAGGEAIFIRHDVSLEPAWESVIAMTRHGPDLRRARTGPFSRGVDPRAEKPQPKRISIYSTLTRSVLE